MGVLVARPRVTAWGCQNAPERLRFADPDQLAGRLNDEQRTALRALLQGYLSSGSETVTALIALKAGADGSTAVTVSAGRSVGDRAQLARLAPYYLTLDATVDDLHFEGEPRLLLSFRVSSATDPN